MFMILLMIIIGLYLVYVFVELVLTKKYLNRIEKEQQEQINKLVERAVGNMLDDYDGIMAKDVDTSDLVFPELPKRKRGK